MTQCGYRSFERLCWKTPSYCSLYTDVATALEPLYIDPSHLAIASGCSMYCPRIWIGFPVFLACASCQGRQAATMHLFLSLWSTAPFLCCLGRNVLKPGVHYTCIQACRYLYWKMYSLDRSMRTFLIVFTTYGLTPTTACNNDVLSTIPSLLLVSGSTRIQVLTV